MKPDNRESGRMSADIENPALSELENEKREGRRT